MKKIFIVILSDTHNKHKHLGELPPADIIIHCGDFTSIGKEHEIRNFMTWYSDLNQYSYKLIIAGNHDWLFETNSLLAKNLVPDNVIYLEDSGVEIMGLNFYGSPVQKRFCNWAFNRDENVLQRHWKAIPDNTDVLITHSPPFSILDNLENAGPQGSPSLYKEVLNRIKPVISTYGHIHSGHGVKTIDNTTFINASNLDEEYQCIYNPVLLEIDENKVVTVISQ